MVVCNMSKVISWYRAFNPKYGTHSFAKECFNLDLPDKYCESVNRRSIAGVIIGIWCGLGLGMLIGATIL